MSGTSRKRQQWIIAGVLGSVGLIGLYSVSQILNTSGGALAAFQEESGITTTMIADRTRAASPEMSWINNASDKVDKLTLDVERLQDALRIQQSNADARLVQEQKETDKVLQSYETKIVSLEKQLQSVASNRRAAPSQVGAGAGGPISLRTGKPMAGGDFVTAASGAVRNPLNPLGIGTGGASSTRPGTTDAAIGNDVVWSPTPFAREFALKAPEVDPNASEQDVHSHLNSFLPAGSYAPALVLSGVDASTAVSSQAEPVPVVFRITGPAITAGTQSTRGHRINLTGCTVTGSARGDLSSERVYVRLLKLSCAKTGGHVFEADVAGYMSGAGKAGARGHVVSREGPLVRNAGIAGAISGLGQAVSGIGNTAAGSDAASLSEALQGAGSASIAGGLGGAADRLSEYYIERAEQYQPVVSLYGGTQVELVFMEGISLE